MVDAAMKLPGLGAPANSEVVALLEDVLARAKRGEVHSVGIVVPPSFTAAAGPHLASVYVTLDILKGRIAAALSGPPSQILTPTRRQ